MKRRALDMLLVSVALVVLWQALHWRVGEEGLASPAATLRQIGEELESPRFWRHVAETAIAFGWALLYSAGGGLVLGLWFGFRRLAGEVAEPVLTAFASLPKVTLYPIMLLVFGLGLPAKVAFGAIHGIVPVVLFSMAAVRNLAPVLTRTARVLRLDARTTALTVLLPAALPEIVSGLRIGFSLTLLGVLIGEMFAAKRGLGFLIMNAIGLNDSGTIMTVATLLFAFAALANAALLALDRHLHHRGD
ncbi:MAG: ABC transporter permease subunit [Alphaproteobacteria bacterium]|nr:ABC transporter permease subunit [Alphaproteobacteria bacterium]